MADEYTSIDNIENLVKQATSRYSLRRTTISEYNGTRMYNYPYSPEIPHDIEDKYIVIQQSIRLDTLAEKEYGDPKMWWIIAKVNNIQNPLHELPHGTSLRIPSMTNLVLNQVIS